MDTNEKITAELVEVLDEKDRQIRNAILGYMMKPPEDRILLARDIFLDFDSSASAQPGSTITTTIPVEDRPDVSIDARIEFPTIAESKTEGTQSGDTPKRKWTDEIVIMARANDRDLKHEQPEFVQLGVVEYHGPSSATLHTKDNKTVRRFAVPEASEIMDIIDHAVYERFDKNEEVRKTMGHDALAKYWEKICSEESIEKPGILNRLKILIGIRPE